MTCHVAKERVRVSHGKSWSGWGEGRRRRPAVAILATAAAAAQTFLSPPSLPRGKFKGSWGRVHPELSGVPRPPNQTRALLEHGAREV